MELGAWSLELEAWNAELGAWNLQLCLELGTWSLKLGAWNLNLEHPVLVEHYEKDHMMKCAAWLWAQGEYPRGQWNDLARYVIRMACSAVSSYARLKSDLGVGLYYGLLRADSLGCALDLDYFCFMSEFVTANIFGLQTIGNCFVFHTIFFRSRSRARFFVTKMS